jgi:hypothetical protein
LPPRGYRATREQVTAFLADFLELSGLRVTIPAIEEQIRKVLPILGLTQFMGKARFIARGLQPLSAKKEGRPTLEEVERITAWNNKMDAKCADLLAKIKHEK